MKEASRTKFYVAKYFLLAVGFIQALAAMLVYLNQTNSAKTSVAIFILMALSLISISLYMLAATKLKRVAISKKKLAVIDRQQIKRYHWDEVKSMKYLPFLNLYCLKLKGRKSRVYFLPVTNSESLFGLFNTAAIQMPKK